MASASMELEFIEGNDRAKCLYEKLGYRVTGELPNAIHSREEQGALPHVHHDKGNMTRQNKKAGLIRPFLRL